MSSRMVCAWMVLCLVVVPVRADDATDGLITEARTALDSDDAQRAIDLLEEISEPTGESLYLLGLAYQARLDQVGLFSKRRVARKLRAALRDALELEPEHIRAREELADFYHYAPAIVGGSNAKRDEQIELLRQYSPASADAVRGRHAYDAGEYREAERHLTAALEHDKGCADLWFLRGRARQNLLEKDAAALADFKRARGLGHDDHRIHYYIGRLCVRLNIEPELAEQSLREYIERSKPKNQALGHYRLAMLREQQGRLEDAQRDIERALRLRPDLEEAKALRQRVERKLGAS